MSRVGRPPRGLYAESPLIGRLAMGCGEPLSALSAINAPSVPKTAVVGCPARSEERRPGILARRVR